MLAFQVLLRKLLMMNVDKHKQTTRRSGVLCFVKPKPKKSFQPITKDKDNTVNQSKREVTSGGRELAAGKRVRVSHD